MKTDQLFIGIDSGTQSVKVVILSRERREVIGDGFASHEIMENLRGGREQHPEAWFEACLKAVSEALKSPGVDRNLVKGVAVSGQQHGMTPLDAEGNVIRPAKLWCDTETARESEILTARLGGPEAVIREIGNTVAVGFTASKLLWLKDKEPENYEKLDTVLLPHDYLNFRLTGEKKTECGDASGTAYFDVRKREWSEKMINAIDDSGRLADALPTLITSDAPCGILRPELAEAWGLPGNVLVASGGGDNMMAAIGTGNVREGVVTASLGTSGTIYAYSESPVVDPGGELAAFCSSTGGWLPLVCTMNVTVATELIRNLFQLEIPEYNALAELASPGSGGLLLLPYFNGERTPPLPNATATLHGMTALNMTPENLCRAFMEGATLGLRYGMDVIRRNGIRPKEIRLVGGGAKSKVWRQMAADAFGLSVVSPISTEAGALGAAIQALWCFCNQTEGPASLDDLCEAYIRFDENSRAEPDADDVRLYNEIYERYQHLDQALRPVNAASRV